MRLRARVRPILPVALPLLILIGTGLGGLDFGLHWDERHYQIGPMRTMIRTGEPLPGYYGYPSLDYWIAAAAVVPDAMVELARGPGARERVLDRIDTHGFLLRLRAVFLVISALSVVWVYLLVLGRRSSVPEALFAATVLASSWEVAYHSRWIATDGVMMQFGALTLLLVMSSQRGPRPGRGLGLAAVAAGLAAGTKYPGALLLAPVLLGGWFAWRSQVGPAALLGRLAALAGGAFATFVATTPAMILAPGAVMDGMRLEIRHYGLGHHGHTVRPGLEHLLRMGEYLGTALLSWYAPIAVCLAFLSVAGMWTLRREPRNAALLLSFPLIYLAYFASQRAMVVRNLIVLAPFLAILAAYGAAGIWHRLPPAGRGRLGFAGALAGMLLVDGWWLGYAAFTIRERSSDRFVREALAFVQDRPRTMFFVSPRVRTHFALVGTRTLPNLTTDPARGDRFVFYANEGVRRYQDWQANRLRLTECWFGPYEVNFNVYPNWWGDDRIVVMSAARVSRLDLLVARRPPP